ncbi:PucR family transcriptional regulator [Pseudonocardia acaciae]|uniref:PucR family transcriptional regulator n=1 Tax=Pseudonocardia acaciae TaxID=551276 RepID=UPI0012ED66D8|nr:helix-turn-helix domain-containing protein [Pseudonocardia acaciae]
MRSTDLDEEIAALAHTTGMKKLLDRLRTERDAMREEADAAVVAEFPELVERADAAVRRQVIDATFRRVVHRLQGRGGSDSDAETHRAFGAAAAYAGVPLERLTTAYRIGARVGWTHIRRAVRELELGGEFALLLADAQLAYVDELTSNTIEGYARAVESTYHRQARERQSLVEDLLSGRATRQAVAELGWDPADEPAVAVLYGDTDLDEPPQPDLLVGTFDGAVIAIGPAGTLERLLRDRPAVLGPPVKITELSRSFERARRLANLVTTGTLTRTGALKWTDELATIIVHGVPEASEELAARRLDPLRDPSAERERMLYDTLAAWLDHPGKPRQIAAHLHLHPQTVHYRLARLRERLGDQLDDPQARFELALALRYRHSAR